MSLKVCINGVVPYKTLRMDCYRQALLPIITYYKKSVVPILLSDYLFYGGGPGTINTYNYQVADLGAAFNDLGIVVRRLVVEKENFVETICNCIDMGTPVASYLDSYFNPNYSSVYQNNHSNHCVPIYGYNKDANTFDIIDSDYIEDFKRKSTTISFDDLERAFLSWSNLYNGGDKIIFAFEDIGLSVKDIDSVYVQKYSRMFSRCNRDFSHHIDSFGRFVEWFSDNYSDEEIMLSKVNEFCRRITEIINGKLKEYYSYKDIFENIDEVYSNMELICENLNYIRAILYKTKFSKRYRERSFYNCISKFNEIVEQEKKQLELSQKYLNPFNLKGVNIL